MTVYTPFDRIYNDCYDWMKKKFSSILAKRGGPLPKKFNFFFHPVITINTSFDSACRVDKKFVVFKNVYNVFGTKNRKNRILIP